MENLAGQPASMLAGMPAGWHACWPAWRVGRAMPCGDPPGGATTTTETTTTETETNIPTATTPHAPAPRDEISRSGYRNPLTLIFVCYSFVILKESFNVFYETADKKKEKHIKPYIKAYMKIYTLVVK